MASHLHHCSNKLEYLILFGNCWSRMILFSWRCSTEGRSNLSLNLLLPDLENFGLLYHLSARLSPSPPNSNCCIEARIVLCLLSPQESNCSESVIPQIIFYLQSEYCWFYLSLLVCNIQKVFDRCEAHTHQTLDRTWISHIHLFCDPKIGSLDVNRRVFNLKYIHAVGSWDSRAIHILNSPKITWTPPGVLVLEKVLDLDELKTSPAPETF